MEVRKWFNDFVKHIHPKPEKEGKGISSYKEENSIIYSKIANATTSQSAIIEEIECLD